MADEPNENITPEQGAENNIQTNPEVTNTLLKEIYDEIKKEEAETQKKQKAEFDAKLSEKDSNYKDAIKTQLKDMIKQQKEMTDIGSKFNDQQKIIEELQKQISNVESGSKTGFAEGSNPNSYNQENKPKQPSDFTKEDYANNKYIYDEWACKKLGLRFK